MLDLSGYKIGDWIYRVMGAGYRVSETGDPKVRIGKIVELVDKIGFKYKCDEHDPSDIYDTGLVWDDSKGTVEPYVFGKHPHRHLDLMSPEEIDEEIGWWKTPDGAIVGGWGVRQEGYRIDSGGLYQAQLGPNAQAGWERAGERFTFVKANASKDEVDKALLGWLREKGTAVVVDPPIKEEEEMAPKKLTVDVKVIGKKWLEETMLIPPVCLIDQPLEKVKAVCDVFDIPLSLLGKLTEMSISDSLLFLVGTPDDVTAGVSDGIVDWDNTRTGRKISLWVDKKTGLVSLKLWGV